MRRRAGAVGVVGAVEWGGVGGTGEGVGINIEVKYGRARAEVPRRRKTEGWEIPGRLGVGTARAASKVIMEESGQGFGDMGGKAKGEIEAQRLGGPLRRSVGVVGRTVGKAKVEVRIGRG